MHRWWWTVGFLLVAAAFTVPRLDYDALSHDELRSYIVAGGAHHRPMSSPAQVWARVAEESPDQALGFPLVIWVWGGLVGWSEFAARTLPMLAGVLAIAVTYRIGRDLLNPFVGVGAAAMLSTSILLITHMHKFRVFTLAVLAVGVTVWCYWRVALAEQRPGWFAQAGLVLGEVSLLYTHYFVAPLLGVLGLYHLLFVPKTRRWWRPVLMLVPVVLVFLPQVPVILQGLALNQDKAALHAQAASPAGVVLLVVQFFSNDFGWLFVLLLAPAAGALTLPALRRNLGYLWFVTLGLLVGIILLNEITQVFEPDRRRYALGLWIPLSVIVAAGMWHIAQWRRYAGVGVLVIWCVFGAYTTWQDELTRSYTQSPPWRALVAPVFAYGEPDDVFLYNGKPDSRHGHYTHGITNRPVIIGNQGAAEIDAALGDPLRVWWGRNLTEGRSLDGTTALITAALDERGFVYCDRYLSHPDAWLMLFAQSAAFCPGGEPIITFGAVLSLAQVETMQPDERLVLNVGWQVSDAMPVNTYTAAFFVFPAGENAPLMQQDISFGLNDGPYTPMQAAFDVSGLERGAYNITVTVYDWQTGERLPVTQSTGDEIAGMPMLEAFRLN